MLAFSTVRNQLPTGLRTRNDRRLARGQTSCFHKVSDAANTLESLICIKINTCLQFPSDVNLHRHRGWPGGRRAEGVERAAQSRRSFPHGIPSLWEGPLRAGTTSESSGVALQGSVTRSGTSVG